MKLKFALISAILAAVCIGQHTANAKVATEFKSHSPMRPLPEVSQRPLDAGPTLFVDPKQGDDANSGTQEKPLRSIQHAVGRLKAGETLCLRGGTYYEHVRATLVGTAERPITIRSFKGELAIIDGGLREFFETPAEAWEVFPGGAVGEFRSVKTYPGLGSGDGPDLLGNFGDSLVPLQGYRFHSDLRSDNPWWNITQKVGDEGSVYCGPGVYYDAATGRIHARLAHTKLPGLGDDNYRGISDPRLVPLVIAGESSGSVFSLANSQHVRFQDVVLRGARSATLVIDNCRDIELDGLTVYGGSTAIQTQDTVGLRMQHTACRGIGGPWTFRGMLKYRSLEARLFSANRWEPSGADHGDFEIAYCEFTDCVDGVFLGNVRGVRFHHNMLDNITDDGMFLTAATGYDGQTLGGDVQIYQNRFSRILTTFAFGVGHGRQRITPKGKQTGSGAHIYRNVFDLRRPVWYTWPKGPDDEQEITSRGRFGGDHGGPAWEPMWIYHNTIIAGGTPRYDYGSDGLIHGLGHGTTRRVFNNIVCLTEGMPGSTLPKEGVDFQGDGNLLWSLKADKPLDETLLAKFRASPAYEASKAKYAAGWTTNDVIADPKLARLSSGWREVSNVQLTADSPAINAGVALPKNANEVWPDPLRESDRGLPDMGALPAGNEGWRVGIRGRLNESGQKVSDQAMPRVDQWAFPAHKAPPRKARRAAIVEGYPAFDAPIVSYLLRKAGWAVDTSERALLDSARFDDYDLLVFDGSMTRAKAPKAVLNAADLENLKAFLHRGGTVLLMRERPNELFASPEGRKFLEELVGTPPRATKPPPTKPQVKVQLREHPWVRHLANANPTLLTSRATPLRTSRGTTIIGSDGGMAALYHLPVGKGQLIYIGWTIADSLPHGRLPTTVEQESQFDEQVAILKNLLPAAQ